MADMSGEAYLSHRLGVLYVFGFIACPLCCQGSQRLLLVTTQEGQDKC